MAGVVRRRLNKEPAPESAARTRSSRAGAASTIGESAGIRSWSSSSAARTMGSRWNRRGIGSSSKTLVKATRLIPWWWAMYDFTTARRWPWGNRSGV